MNLLLATPVILPIMGAALSIIVGRWRNVQRVIGLAVLSVVLACTVALAVLADRDGPMTTQGGNWPAPLGITLIADRFAGIMLVIGAVTLLCVLVYAIGQGGTERDHVGFHPIYLTMAAGVSAAFLTGDLFNLFVSFEIMLVSSYVLLTLGGRRDQVRAGMTYVVISLVASALFLTAIGFVYASTGTVNMALLAEELTQLPVGLRQALVLLLFAVFGIKAAIFPLFFWLPDSYPTAPTAVTAVFAGILTKVGVYAIVRTQTLLVEPADRPGTLLLGIASVTMIVGVLGAIAQNDIKRILSFHIVSQIGYMIMGLGFFTVAGIAGAIFFIAHQIVVKTSVFLVGGMVEHQTGTGQLDRVGGVMRTTPVLAVLFLASALSLAGLPPLSGFVGKFALVTAGLDAGAWTVVGISLFVSVLTLFSMVKIWTGVFGGDITPPVDSHKPIPGLMRAGTTGLVVVSLAMAVFAGPMYGFTDRAATELLDPDLYRSEVLGP